MPVRAAANPNAELIAEFEPERRRIPRRAWNRGARIIARAIGDSMDGGRDPIRNGELAYLKQTRSPRTANNHIALVRRGEGLYLKIFETSGHTIRLVSTNGEKAIELDARGEDLQIYGYVVDHGPSE
jgi:phage repressor protein C with HTH and peptisase S24 domain